MIIQADMTVSDTTIVPPPSLGDLEREEALAKRFSRKNIFHANLVFEFTRDPALLQQYYQIRAHEYNAVLGLQHYPVVECEHDLYVYILVERQGNFCVGGVRVNIKTPRKPALLPLETGDFRLEKYFPHLQHNQLSYAQVSGLALLSEFRGGAITISMLKRILDKCFASNVSTLFATCPLPNARLYKHDWDMLGFKDSQIYYDIDLAHK